MKRTQIQLPDPLYVEVKRVAKLQDWSVTEVLRRGAEYIVRCYDPATEPGKAWKLPAPRKLGRFKTAPADWRDLAQELDPKGR